MTNNINNVTKSFEYGPGKRIERTYERVSIKEMAELMGTDKKDVNDAIVTNSEATAGMFIPRPGCYNNEYISAILAGDKPVFFNNEIDLVEPPRIEECSFVYLRPEIWKYSEVLEFHPKRYHRKGVNKGKVILDDLTFSASIFAKVCPTPYREWIERQKEANSMRLNKATKDFMMVDSTILKKIRGNVKTHHKKGKLGKMVLNCKKRLDIKRKRLEQERAQMKEEDLRDKVYFPPENVTVVEDIPESKKFVDVTEYVNLKDQALIWNTTLFEISAHAQSIPWKTTRHLPDPDQELYQYNEVRFEVQKCYAKWDITIPTFEEAKIKYGGNN